MKKVLLVMLMFSFCKNYKYVAKAVMFKVV
jgi:hypothetical protein